MALTGFDESQLIPVDEFGFDESQLIPVEEPEIKPPPVDMGIPQIGTLPNISRGYSVPTTETVSTPTEILPPEHSMFQRALAAYKMTAKPFQEDINQLQQYSLGKATGLIKGVDAQTLANAVDVLKASGQLVDKGDFSAESWNQALGTPNRPPTRMEKILAGGQSAVAETADFFTTPLGIATLGVGGLPAAAQKAVTATFTADMAAKSPELYYEIQNAWKSGDTERLTKALVSAGLNTAFIAKGAKETFKGAKETFDPETVKPTEVPEAKPAEVPKAAEEVTGETLQTPEGKPMPKSEMDALVEQNPDGFFDNLVSPDGTKRRVFRTGKVLGGKERFKAASELEGKVRPTDGYPAEGEYFESDKQNQIVKSVIDNARASNPDINIRMMDETEIKGHEGDPIWTNPKGEIVINPKALSNWIARNKLTVENLKTWLEAGLPHEVIHSNALRTLSPDEIMNFWNSATALEKNLTRRAYNRKWGKGPTNETALAHEMYRRQMERTLGLTPTEVVQSRGMEWLTQKFIDSLERGVFEARRTLGTKASKAQQSLLDRYQQQIDMVRNAKGWQSPKSEGEQKDLRMTPSEEAKSSLEEDIDKYNKLQARFKELAAAKQYTNPEFEQVWKESEAIKNRHGGFVPGTGPTELRMAPKEEKPASVTGIPEAFKEMGQAISANLYERMWKQLQAGKYPDIGRSRTGDLILAEYKKGNIKSAEDIRTVVGKQEPTKPPVPPTKPPETVATAPEAEGARYGIAARVSEERAARGDIPGEPIRGPGISASDAIIRGRKLKASGVDPVKVMETFENTKAISGDGMAVIRAHGEDLFEEAVKAQRQFGRNSPEYKAAQKADYDWLVRVKRAQTEWHDIGAAQQGETDIDTGSFHGLQRAFFETTGRDFTPQEAKTAERMANTNQEATAVETKAKEDFYKAKDETVKTATDDAKKVWERAKSYIEKGEGSIDDIRHKVATDLGMPVSEVTRLLTETKQHKRMLDDVWKKQEQARRLRTLTKQWLRARAIPGYLRALSNVPRILFGMKVAFHGTVALGTHAPMLLWQPPWWTTYFKNYYKMYRMVGSPAYFEMQMQDLMRNKNYITGRRAGLQTDPFQYEEYTDPKIAKAIGILTRSGTRGYGVLKLIRQDMFDTMWDRLPESDQTPDMAASMADGINHVTGVTKKGAPKGAHLALFAPRLMASRAMWLAGDPARAATTLLNWKNATKAEKQFAMNQLKEKAWVSGTLFALLAANQGFLKAIDSDQEVNFTDPNKSDFLKFKVAGMDAAYGNPMITMARLPSRMVKIRDGDTGKLKNVILPDAETYAMLLGYLRSQASPAAGLAADQWFMADYQNRPLPSSNRPVPKRLRQQGLGPYTWPEYLSETLSPIPFQEAIKEVWKTGMGMSDEQIRQYLKALGTIAFQAGTGARVAEDTHLK